MVYTDLHYFGCLSYYKVFTQQELVLFDLTAAFSKMSFKNRMVIATAHGVLNLTIPIVGGRDQKTPMNEIRIAYDSSWKEQHYKSISTNYKRAPYFEHYVDSLEQLYKQNYVYLNTFLLATQHWIQHQLKANWLIESTTEGPAAFSVTKWVDPFKPNNFQTAPQNILYHQVFDATTGFLNNLCILDLLFAMGGRQANVLLT